MSDDKMPDGTPETLQDIEPAWLDPSRSTMDGESGWGSYWESIEEQRASFSSEARHYVKRLMESCGIRADADVLDFGCGFGHVAQCLAPQVHSLSLWDGSAHVRRIARPRVAGIPNVRLVDLSTDAAMERHRGRYDFILVHSVTQYMSSSELASWLQRWKRLLGDGGAIVVSDILRPGISLAREMAGVLRFAWKNGVFIPVLKEKSAHAASYLFARQQRKLLVLSEDDWRRLAAEHGLEMTALPENLSYFTGRLALMLSHCRARMP